MSDLPHLREGVLDTPRDRAQPLPAGLTQVAFLSFPLKPDLCGDESLLDAVVKVALELAPLIIRGAHQSRARTLQLLQRLLPARFQLRILSRQEHGGAGCFQELRVVVELWVVNDRDRRRALVGYECHGTAGFGG